jgi:hypothetical protein
MSTKEFIRELNGNKRVEGEIIKTLFVSLSTSLITLFLLYFLKFQYIENFLEKFGFYFFLLVMSIAIIMPSIRQVRAFKRFPCMIGMMIGMTIGMISGFLFGFYVGATNGMFWGSFYGMVFGIFFGVWMGKCCGIMGIMEGIMAGFMGGLMGAMTSIMMYNDNLKAAGLMIFGVCSLIMICLNYMLYQETKNESRVYFENQRFTIIISFLITLITSLFMIYGPRSVLFQ